LICRIKDLSHPVAAVGRVCHAKKAQKPDWSLLHIQEGEQSWGASWPSLSLSFSLLPYTCSMDLLYVRNLCFSRDSEIWFACTFTVVNDHQAPSHDVEEQFFFARQYIDK
jgi:hypothetical protein